MNYYLIGTDVIGAATVRVYTDSDTVRVVQQWLAERGGGKAFTSRDGSPLKVDGVIGPDTEAAVKKFNAAYRNKPEDREWITEGTLASMGIRSTATPAEVISQKDLPIDGRPAKGWSQPQPDKMSPAITPESPGEKPRWKTGLGIGLGVVAAAAIAGGLALLARRYVA